VTIDNTQEQTINDIQVVVELWWWLYYFIHDSG